MRAREEQLLCSTTNRRVYNVLIKRKRANSGEVNCAFCRYHRNENAGRKDRERKLKLRKIYGVVV